MDNNIVEKFMMNRNTQYSKKSVRDCMVLLRESIHDLVRTGELKKLKTPLSVSWALTYSCNLYCKHCYASKEQLRELSLNQCLKMIEKLKKLNILDVSLEGGEPLVRTDFFDILKRLKKEGFSVDILTNATLINKRKADLLSGYLGDLDRIQISIDGWNIDNDKIRGKGTYNTVINNIKQLYRIKNITINTVITKENINNIEYMIKDIVENTEIKKIHFSPLMSIGKADSNMRPNSFYAMEKYMNIKEKYSQYVEISGTPIPDFFLLNDEKYKKYLDTRIINQIKVGCCAGRSKIYIRPDGWVTPCTFLNDEKLFCSIDDIINGKSNEVWEDIINHAYKDSTYINKSKNYTEYCLGEIFTSRGIKI